MLANQVLHGNMSGVELRDTSALSALANVDNAFVIMSTTSADQRPAAITELLTRANVPIVSLPFDLDTIEELIHDASEQVDDQNSRDA